MPPFTFNPCQNGNFFGSFHFGDSSCRHFVDSLRILCVLSSPLTRYWRKLARQNRVRIGAIRLPSCSRFSKSFSEKSPKQTTGMIPSATGVCRRPRTRPGPAPLLTPAAITRAPAPASSDPGGPRGAFHTPLRLYVYRRKGLTPSVSDCRQTFAYAAKLGHAWGIVKGGW